MIYIASSGAIVAAEPATVEKAAAVWNGLTWTVPKDVKEPQRQLAALGYETGGDAQSAFDFQKKALVAAKWKEEPGAYLSKESCSATYRKDGYALSLMSFPVQPDRVNVMLTAHGNVDLSKLPVPTGAKSTFVGPASAMFTTDASPDKTTDAVTGLLTKQGWQPYGSAGDVRSFKQNAVKLNAFIAAAPAQGGKTSITYSTELMSADLPAPTTALDLQYADVTKTLTFKSFNSVPELLKFYQTSLSAAGWKSTTDTLNKADFKEVMIFRNAAKDLLTLEFHEREGLRQCSLKHESAAEVQAKYELEKAAATKAVVNNAPKDNGLKLELPAGAKGVNAAEGSIEFTIAPKDVKSAVQEITTALKKAGWKLDKQMDNAGAGAVLLSKGDADIIITYIGLAGLPGSVTINATGVKLERPKER